MDLLQRPVTICAEQSWYASRHARIAGQACVSRTRLARECSIEKANNRMFSIISRKDALMELALVTCEQKNILKNLIKMYCYEWSQYNGIDINEFGEYAFEHDIDRYFTEADNYPYFIRNGGKLAGFVLIDTDFDYDKNSDHAVSEFFVLYKYRKMGIGRSAATETFNKHKGKWEIKMHPMNKTSIDFWTDVVGKATNGKYHIIKNCEQAKYSDGNLGTIIVFNNKGDATCE